MAHVEEAQNERNVVILTGVGHFSTHYIELMFPTLAVALAADTGLPVEQVLGWSFLGYLLFGLGAVPAGLLADRISARILLIAAMGGMGVFAMAAGEVSGDRALIVCLAGMGAFAGVYHPVGMSLISRTIRARGRALGVNGIFGSAAIASTPLLTAAMCSLWGWQSTYMIVGFALFAVAVLCAFLPVDERAVPELEPAPGARRQSGSSSTVLFVVLLGAALLGGIVYRGSTLIQPAYFAERVSLLGFGAATSLVYLLGVGGQYFGGALADRHDLRWLYIGFHALSLPFLLAMTVLFELPLLAVAAAFVFFSLGMQPIENSLFAHITPLRWRATGYGIKFVATFGGGSLAVWLVEWARGAGGEASLPLVLYCLAGAVAALLAVAAAFTALSGGPIRNQAVPPPTWQPRQSAAISEEPVS